MRSRTTIIPARTITQSITVNLIYKTPGESNRRAFCCFGQSEAAPAPGVEDQLMIVKPPLVPPKRGFTTLLKIEPKL